MPRISKCSVCSEEVLIPDVPDETILVRCPLCEAEYPVSEVTAEATEAPPELVMVAMVADAGPAVDSAESQTEVPESGTDADNIPDSEAAAPETSETETEEPEVDPWAFLRGSETEADTGIQDAAEDEVSEADIDDVDTGTDASESEKEPAVDESPQLNIPVEADDASRKKKEKSLLREFVGVVVGGLVGLSIAYYGLNWWGGERANFIKVYLPGIPHTYQHRPDWMPNWMPGTDPREAPSGE